MSRTVRGIGYPSSGCARGATRPLLSLVVKSRRVEQSRATHLGSLRKVYFLDTTHPHHYTVPGRLFFWHTQLKVCCHVHAAGARHRQYSYIPGTLLYIYSSWEVFLWKKHDDTAAGGICILFSRYHMQLNMIVTHIYTYSSHGYQTGRQATNIAMKYFVPNIYIYIFIFGILQRTEEWPFFLQTILYWKNEDNNSPAVTFLNDTPSEKYKRKFAFSSILFIYLFISLFFVVRVCTLELAFSVKIPNGRFQEEQKSHTLR